jgi:hypothetical protein
MSGVAGTRPSSAGGRVLPYAGRRGLHAPTRILVVCIFALAAVALLGASSSSAAVGGRSAFGGNGTEGGQFEHAGGLAINQTGAGGVEVGDIYVTDPESNRVQEFDEDGTFVRAFGADVGGAGVDVCTVPADCGPGAESADAAAVPRASRVAIDQSTGAVFVAGRGRGLAGPDRPNNRIDVFSATGVFEGAFGWDVDAAAPAQALQFCTTATGCLEGSSGSGAGQLPIVQTEFGPTMAMNPVTGRLVVADTPNLRIDEFEPTYLGGDVTGISFVRAYGWGVRTGAQEFQICTATCHAPTIANPNEPGAFGETEQPRALAIDSDGNVYAAGTTGPTGRENRIEKFSDQGAYLGDFVASPAQASEGRLLGPLSFSASTGDLLVYESGGDKNIRALGPAGETVESFVVHPEGSLFSGNVEALAEEEATGLLVASEFEAGGVVVFGEPILPLVSIDPVVNPGGTRAVFEGTVDPTGLFASYKFEYSTDGGVTWTVAGQSGRLPADEVSHAVSGEAVGLEALTEYKVRLVAEKAFVGGRAQAETTFQTGPAAPNAGATSAAAISESGASLIAKLNPESEATEYQFECVDQTSFEQSEFSDAFKVPNSPETVNASEAITVQQTVTGLSETATYHCRLSARNGTGSNIGPETVFVTYRSTPGIAADGRVYEQASPVDKNGSDAGGWQYLLGAAADGDGITYYVGSGGSTGVGGQEFPLYDASRSESESAWGSTGLLPPSSVGNRALILGWSQDLTRDYVLAWNSGSTATFYIQDLADGTLEQVATGLAPYEGARVAGESNDETEILFESPKELVKGAVSGVPNLYSWNRITHSLTLVSLLPGEVKSSTGSFAGPYDWPDKEPKAGGALAGAYTNLHAFSADGTTAFFTTRNVGHLYVRKHIGGAGSSTVQVDASQKTNGSGPGGTDPQGAQKAAFMVASTDGTRVFFTSPSELTNDATTGTADQGNDLYRYEVASGQLIDVAPDTSDPTGAEVQGVLGASADGSYVYFAANGVLAEGAAPGNCRSSAVTGWGAGEVCNLYVWHEGEITFISSIGPTVASGGLNWMPLPSIGSSIIAMNPARVSTDGHTLVFATSLSVTGYASEGHNEFYRFNTESGLTCVSCNPTGAPPVGRATLQDIEPGVAKPSIPGTSSFIRNMSADGDRVFFETPDKLVSADTNGDHGCPEARAVKGCQDVYEWEAENTGSCRSHDEDGGCLYLISTGKSAEPSFFAGASENGKDVFFFTQESLVGQDKDQLYDVYDARVGGGLAGQSSTPPTSCEGVEACQGPGPSSVVGGSPGTASFTGPGNPPQKNVCRKGFKRKGKKCVRKSPPKKHKSKPPKKHKSKPPKKHKSKPPKKHKSKPPKKHKSTSARKHRKKGHDHA